MFAVQRRAPVSIETDSGATFLCSNYVENTANTLQQYQFRIGGRYFPASPVQVSIANGSGVCNGGAEAYIELQKMLNIVGDYRLSTGVNKLRWAIPPAASNTNVGTYSTQYLESDFAWFYNGVANGNTKGQPAFTKVTIPAQSAGNGFSGNAGSSCFAMAIDLETSNGVEISGLNAEEQSDISLIATYAEPQDTSFVIEVYAYYDAMIILRENNVLDLIL